jgi:hypothetical protein
MDNTKLQNAVHCLRYGYLFLRLVLAVLASVYVGHAIGWLKADPTPIILATPFYGWVLSVYIFHHLTAYQMKLTT